MKKLGWIRDSKDSRDIRYQAKGLTSFPAKADFRERYPRPWDQGSIGSCTAHAVGAAALFKDIYDHDTTITVPSRLWIYYKTREIEGTTEKDVGAQIRNAMKVVVSRGYPLEDHWPYNVKDFATKPPDELSIPATRERVKSYQQVGRDLNEFKEVLSEGHPIVLGFSVYPSIYKSEVTRSGFIPLPEKGEVREGGHAVLACGYDDEKGVLIIRNSWGEDWGEGGYGYLPYGYITDRNLSANFWTIR